MEKSNGHGAGLLPVIAYGSALPLWSGRVSAEREGLTTSGCHPHGSL